MLSHRFFTHFLYTVIAVTLIIIGISLCFPKSGTEYDRDLIHKIKQNFENISSLEQVHIYSIHGNVELKGHVFKRSHSDLAEQLAETTPGVKQVDNKLVIDQEKL